MPIAWEGANICVQALGQSYMVGIVIDLSQQCAEAETTCQKWGGLDVHEIGGYLLL